MQRATVRVVRGNLLVVEAFAVHCDQVTTSKLFSHSHNLRERRSGPQVITAVVDVYVAPPVVYR